MIYGDIQYSNPQNIDTNFFQPNIMGPFSYIPFMECNHAILNMKNRSNGYIHINNHKIKFNQDVGYIEKDWGTSFPKSYIWCQGNQFQKEKASFMFSVANIPFKFLQFKGIICVLMVDDKEYRFATYNMAKLIKYNVDENSLNVVLKKGRYSIHIKSNYNEGLKLIAPVKGKMEKDIIESISAIVSVILKKDHTVIFSDTSKNCGLEIVRE